MTNVKMLEYTYEMLELAVKTANPEDEKAAETIRKMLLTFDFVFREVIEKLSADIRKEEAKKSGRSKQTSAANRIIKIAIRTAEYRKEMHGAWIGKNGNQYISSGYHAVMFNKPLPLPEAAGFELGEQVIQKAEIGQELKLPTVSELKNVIAKYKAKTKDISKKNGKPAEYDFGDNLPAVNAQYLIDMLEVLPESTATYTGLTNPVRFESPEGVGVLMPIKKTNKE